MTSTSVLEKGEEKQAVDEKRGEERIKKAGYPGNLVVAALGASLGSFSFGYNMGSLNAVSTVLTECTGSQGAWGCVKVTEAQSGYIASFLCLGALIGCLSGGKIIDRLGRRGLILWNNVSFVMGLGLMVGSTHWTMLMIGRLLVGVGVGVSCVAVPMYLTEVSSWDVRGVIGSLHQLMIVVGYLLALLFGLTLKNTFYMWRIIIGADLLVCGVQVLMGMVGLVRESPKHSMLKDDQQAAEDTLKWLRGPAYDEREQRELGTTQVVKPLGLITLVRTRLPEVYKSLLIVALLHLAQQLSGVNAIFYFSSQIFANSVYVPIGIAVLNVVMTVVSLALMDRAGRRPLLLLSTGGMILAYILFTVAEHGSMATLKATSVLFYIASFALGMGPVPWLMLGEIFSPWSVSAGVTLGVGVNWVSNFIVVAIFQPQLNLLGRNVMLPYLVVLVLVFLWAALCLPETKGRPAALL